MLSSRDTRLSRRGRDADVLRQHALRAAKPPKMPRIKAFGPIEREIQKAKRLRISAPHQLAIVVLPRRLHVLPGSCIDILELIGPHLQFKRPRIHVLIPSHSRPPASCRAPNERRRPRTQPSPLNRKAFSDSSCFSSSCNWIWSRKSCLECHV